MEPPNEGHVVLVGEMGVGKTTVGRLLAESLGRPFLDSDDVLLESTGRTGAAIASAEGVDALHEFELAALASMMRTSMPSVIAPAASVVGSEEGRDLLRGCVVVWLVAPDPVLDERQLEGRHRRSLISEERLLLRKRRACQLTELGVVKIDTASESPEETARRVVSQLPGSGMATP